MTPEAIEEILTTFRGWLRELPAENTAPAVAPAPPWDVQTVVAQFTALRHDVNLQTKASRTATEQAAAALKMLESAPKPDSRDELRPLIKLLVDIVDALLLAQRQVTRTTEALESLLEKFVPPPIPTLPEQPVQKGFLARLFGGSSADPYRVWAEAVHDQFQHHLDSLAAERSKLSQLLQGLADGYQLSLRRVEKVFPTCGLEAIDCLDQPFDADTMEVVEVVEKTAQGSGTVVEELRRGYFWQGQLFRCAQVKVAR